MNDEQEKLVEEWLSKLAARSAPRGDLPAPGLLLFKARLIEKQSAATSALRPLFWMRSIALGVFTLSMLWMITSAHSPAMPLLHEAVLSLSPLAVLVLLGIIAAAGISLGFMVILRRTIDR